MIKVTIYENKHHEITGFDAAGHAGYADAGSDIVCAAASTLVINTVNSIEKLTDQRFTLDVDDRDDSNLIAFRLEGNKDRDAVLLLNSMILGLQDMEDNSEYRPYIDIIFEEV